MPTERKRWKGPLIGAIFLIAVAGFIVGGRREEEDVRGADEPKTPAYTALSRNVSRTTGPFPTPAFTSDDPVRGPQDAPVTIVEFSDFECPFCRQAFSMVRESLQKYPTKVRFQYRDFPIADVHLGAFPAAEAAECAHAQGKFWEYHDLLFDNQGNFGRESLARYAITVGLNLADFNACLDGRAKRQEVEDDFNTGVGLGVQGTPTWFVNGVKYEGVLSLEEFGEIIDGLLK